MVSSKPSKRTEELELPIIVTPRRTWVVEEVETKDILTSFQASWVHSIRLPSKSSLLGVLPLHPNAFNRTEPSPLTMPRQCTRKCTVSPGSTTNGYEEPLNGAG